MLSTRFIALVAASLAVSAAVAAPKAAAATVNSTSIANPDVEAGSIYGCQTHDFKGACDTVDFVNGACTNLPTRQVNNMDSVSITNNWICTFYDTSSGCDEATATATTTLIAPGSFDLNKQNFGDRVDTFKCFLRC
ncbi:hypothetical protein DFH06DRAFT_1346979 [Mycena polygramma]|nr:hypothetical protein DFH06DRAFT_1346979 [Mycena polygramma]